MDEIIRLVSSDREEFHVKMRTICRSLTIMRQLRLRPNSNNFLLMIDGKTLEKVIDYCNKHDVPYSSLGDEAVVRDLNAFDAGFVNVDETTLFTLSEAAHYLKIKSLVDLTCGTLAKKFERKNHVEMGEVIDNWKENAA